MEKLNKILKTLWIVDVNELELIAKKMTERQNSIKKEI